MKKDLYLKPTIRVVEMRSRSQMLQFSKQSIETPSTTMNVKYTNEYVWDSFKKQ